MNDVMMIYGGPSETCSGPGGGEGAPCAKMRAALYCRASACALIDCWREAEGLGCRVVTAVRWPDKHFNPGLNGPDWDALVARLCNGEFEAIVADTGDRRLVTVGPLANLPEARSASKPVDQPVRCAIYARSAAVPQRRKDPLSRQILICGDRAARNGWATVGVYRDKGLSGSAGVRRAGLESLLEAAARRDFDFVLVDDLSRLGRSILDLMMILRKLAGFGIEVVTADNRLATEVLATANFGSWGYSIDDHAKWKSMALREAKRARRQINVDPVAPSAIDNRGASPRDATIPEGERRPGQSTEPPYQSSGE